MWRDRLYCKSCEHMDEVPDDAVNAKVNA